MRFISNIRSFFSEQKFDPGNVTITEHAEFTFDALNDNAEKYIQMHVRGVWGSVPKNVKERNNQSISGGYDQWNDQIVSQHRTNVYSDVVIISTPGKGTVIMTLEEFEMT
jgi:hypothetical protein